VLGSEFEYFAHPLLQILEVLVLVGATFPSGTALDELHAPLPGVADEHALIELESDVREGRLPDIVFLILKFALKSFSNGLGYDAEGVLHSLLWVDQIAVDVNSRELGPNV
jgi:hypothetical protein